MTTRERVRTKTGVPEASDFDSPLGTPIVIDDTASSGGMFFLDANDVIREAGDSIGYTTSYATTVTAGSGAITTLGTVVCKVHDLGKLQFFYLDISITTNGTGGQDIRATLPSAVAEGTMNGVGWENSTGRMVFAAATSGSTVVIKLYDGSYPGGDGYRIFVRGWYIK